MKVLNLQCDVGHSFEGWFGSDDDYNSQCERGLVECPLCASRSIQRLPSAPRLNLSAHQAPEAQHAEAASQHRQPLTPEQQSVESLWLRAIRHVMANTDDVGDRFASEARRMHYGEIGERGIRGHASREEAQQLREEGIEILSLPIPAAAKEPLQ
jgi:hypothetical protein